MGKSLDDFEKFLHEQEMPLLIQLALAHYQFEVIHPFLDGNGRIGRLMIPLLLIVRGALTQPLLYLSAYFDQFRDEYFDLLLTTSQNGDLLPWIRFFLHGVRRQAREAEERTVRLVDLRQRVHNELLLENRPNSVIRLADYLFNLPFITAKGAAEALGISRPTAYAAIKTLVERGDLVELGERSRNRIYQAHNIFEAVYGSLPGHT